MPATVIIANNTFVDVEYPLVLVDRYFHFEEVDGRLIPDVFRWDNEAQERIYEVKGGVPIDAAFTTNPTGIVTVSSQDGDFLYKLRPKPGVSQIFGRVPAQHTWEVRVTDRILTILRDGQATGLVGSNTFRGMRVGIGIGFQDEAMPPLPSEQ